MFLDYFFYSILCQCNNVSSILTTGTSCVGSVYSSAALCLSGYILLRGITREQWPGNYVLTGLKESTDHFLKHLYDLGIKLGSKINVIELSEFDKSAKITLDNRVELIIGGQVTNNLMVRHE